jgi:hypothetical protein
LLIGKTQRARKALIRKMTSHVRYIMDNMENQNIPVNWKTLAMQGEPYWIDSVEESAVTPSTAEKKQYCGQLSEAPACLGTNYSSAPQGDS